MTRTSSSAAPTARTSCCSATAPSAARATAPTASARTTPADDADALASWPSELGDLEVGARVDALDHREQWFTGTVVAVDDDGGRYVHFDRFSSKWDEWYTKMDWRDNKLAPQHRVKLRPRMLDLYVVRRNADADEPEGYGARRAAPASKELFSLPFVVRCPSDKACKYAHRLVALQALRFVNRETRAKGQGARRATRRSRSRSACAR